MINKECVLHKKSKVIRKPKQSNGLWVLQVLVLWKYYTKNFYIVIQWALAKFLLG